MSKVLIVAAASLVLISTLVWWWQPTSVPTANLYEQAAHWHLALLYLKADDKKQSKLALKQVLALGVHGKYAQQAQLLLADLEK